MKTLKNLWIDLTWRIRMKYYDIFDCWPYHEPHPEGTPPWRENCSTEYHTDNI